MMRPALALAVLVSFSMSVLAQSKTGGVHKAPDPGYVYPPNLRIGETTNVQIGFFDGTPDLEFFVFDPRIKLQTTGAPGPVLVPPPPYWFGSKSTIAPLPLPREQPAKITVPADMPPGAVRWTVANASGAGPKTGLFWVGNEPAVVEHSAKGPQKLPPLPIVVSGRLAKIEEVDRYTFSRVKDGPVTLELFARRLGANMNPTLLVRNAAGRVVADAVDTDGQDLALTFSATAGAEYTAELHDLDFRGDRSFVYRLCLTPGPRIVSTIPAVAKRGSSHAVELIGYGLATGQPRLESITKTIAFPSDPRQVALAYTLETPFGSTPSFAIPLSDLPETTAPPNGRLSLPAAVTGVMDPATGKARFRCEGKKGDVWELAAEARRFGSPLDLSLAVMSAEGKELVRADDLPGTTDAGLTFTLPADGPYTIEVADLAGNSGPRSAIFRLTAMKPARDFSLTTAPRLNITAGASTELVISAKRQGGHKEPIMIKLNGLPEGVTVPENLVIPEGKVDVKVAMTAAKDAATSASLFTVTGTSGALTRNAFAPVSGNLAVKSPDDERSDRLLAAVTLKPQIKLVNVEADGGRKVHRGTTHPSEVTIERLEDFKGEVSLQMSAAQSYQRQGITGPDLTVPANADRAFYPCFMPEWLETTRTSRMELIGVVRVPDARGKLRYLVAPMAGRITMSIEGSILKVSHGAKSLLVKPGATFIVPVTVLRSPKLTESVKLELLLPEDLPGAFQAEPVIVAPGQTAVEFRVSCYRELKRQGEVPITIRGTALQQGKYAVVSETTVLVEVSGE